MEKEKILELEKEKGGACHIKDEKGNNYSSCFYRKIKDDRKTLEFIL